ncbi:hypothetical protein SeMB42_g05587 [Synchytrium endobioticum]|nr:hypothetical protein SeMB42_g05587 [Synchytrium endobioticum]
MRHSNSDATIVALPDSPPPPLITSFHLRSANKELPLTPPPPLSENDAAAPDVPPSRMATARFPRRGGANNSPSKGVLGDDVSASDVLRFLKYAETGRDDVASATSSPTSPTDPTQSMPSPPSASSKRATSAIPHPSDTPSSPTDSPTPSHTSMEKPPSVLSALSMHPARAPPSGRAARQQKSLIRRGKSRDSSYSTSSSTTTSASERKRRQLHFELMLASDETLKLSLTPHQLKNPVSWLPTYSGDRVSIDSI